MCFSPLVRQDPLRGCQAAECPQNGRLARWGTGRPHARSNLRIGASSATPTSLAAEEKIWKLPRRLSGEKGLLLRRKVSLRSLALHARVQGTTWRAPSRAEEGIADANRGLRSLPLSSLVTRPRQRIEGLLRRPKVAVQTRGGIRILAPNSGTAATLGPDPVDALEKLALDLEIRVNESIRVAAIVELQVPEGQQLVLCGADVRWPIARAESVVVQGARGVWLLGKPHRLLDRRVEQVPQHIEHPEAGEGQGLDFGEELQRNAGDGLHENEHQSHSGTHRCEAEGSPGGADGSEECRIGPSHRSGVQHEEGVDGTPPRQEVNVLEVGNTVVQAQADDCEAWASEPCRHYEHQGGEQLHDHCRHREQVQQGGSIKDKTLHFMREGRRDFVGPMITGLAEQHRLEDVGL